MKKGIEKEINLKVRKRKKRVSELQLILTVLFVVCLLVSNIIAGKQIQLPFNIVMTGAVFIFPITYILSDLFSEVYGYRWSRITCYLGFAMNLFMVLVFTAVIKTPAPVFWQNQEAFQIVLGNTPKILFASLLAFMVGDFINDRVFKKFKEKHPEDHKGFETRAILSSLCGEIMDSAIFLPIAFLGTMPIQTLLVMGVTQVSIKIAYEIIILPITRLAVQKISKYEGVNKCTKQ